MNVNSTWQSYNQNDNSQKCWTSILRIKLYLDVLGGQCVHSIYCYSIHKEKYAYVPKCSTHSVPATLSYENLFLWLLVTSTALKHKINWRSTRYKETTLAWACGHLLLLFSSQGCVRIIHQINNKKDDHITTLFIIFSKDITHEWIQYLFHKLTTQLALSSKESNTCWISCNWCDENPLSIIAGRILKKTVWNCPATHSVFPDKWLSGLLTITSRHSLKFIFILSVKRISAALSRGISLSPSEVVEDGDVWSWCNKFSFCSASSSCALDK